MPVLVGDYPTLVGQRLERIQQGLMRFEQQLAVLKTAPLRMADDDWRAQTHSLLDDLAASSADLRGLGARSGADAALYAEVLKLLDNLDFVVSEYRMAFDFDPDATHFIRAGRAEKTTADEVESLLSDLRRPIGPAPTPSFARWTPPTCQNHDATHAADQPAARLPLGLPSLSRTRPFDPTSAAACSWSAEPSCSWWPWLSGSGW
jgi:hypothetical protein